MKMKWLLAYLIVGMSVLSYAQVDSPDPAAKKLLDKISKDLSGLDQVKVDFSLSIEIPERETEVLEGSLWQKGDLYKLISGERDVYNDGSAIYIYNKRNNEVQVNDIEDGDDAGILSPTTMLSSYQNGDYYYAITDHPVEAGVKKVKIDFKPLKSHIEYAKISVYVNQATSTLDRMVIFGKDASRYTMSIKSMDKNVIINKDAFEFKESKYPGVYVEDLRID